MPRRSLGYELLVDDGVRPAVRICGHMDRDAAAHRHAQIGTDLAQELPGGGRVLARLVGEQSREALALVLGV